MRRSFSLAFASSVVVGLACVPLLAPGCTANPLGVQDLCGWIGDRDNCYRRFAEGVVMPRDLDGKVTGEPKCGVRINSAGDAVDASDTVIPPEKKATAGAFLTREKLDICILTGGNGGQIKFDPPLDPGVLPPLTPFTFKMLDGTGKQCGTGSFGGVTSFSIGFDAPMTTSSTSTGGLTAPVPLIDKSADPIYSGTFSSTPGDPSGIINTVCPNDEAHRFDLFQLDRCGQYKAILPTAEIEVSAGGIAVPGYVRLHVFWPPTDDTALENAKPLEVEYFDCSFPGAIHPCADGAQDGAEVDVDCGFSACGVGCADGANCITEKDCISTICAPNAAGLKKCVSTPCGDGIKKGAETCDDGNTNGGDGCSASCSQEAGFTCPTEGSACVDIDECATKTDTCDPVTQDCKNTPGSFTCECKPKFTLDPMTMTCKAGCGDGTKVAPEACDDGNTTDGDGCTVNCTVEKGFTCSGEGKGSCVDIDECVAMTSDCKGKETCVNTIGSFMCNCDSPNKVCDPNGCVSVIDDPKNCGACGKECKPTEKCMDMSCVAGP